MARTKSIARTSSCLEANIRSVTELRVALILTLVSGAGCTVTELRSLPNVDGIGWTVVDKVRIEGPGIVMGLRPDNGEWSKAFSAQGLFVRGGFQATEGGRFKLDPTTVFLEYKGRTYKPLVFLCNKETDRRTRPNPQIVSTEPLHISDKVVCAFFKYDIPAPDTKEDFTLQVGALTRENVAIKVPPIRFREGRLEQPGRMF